MKEKVIINSKVENMLFRQKIQSYKLIGLIFVIALPLFCSLVFLVAGGICRVETR